MNSTKEQLLIINEMKMKDE